MAIRFYTPDDNSDKIFSGLKTQLPAHNWQHWPHTSTDEPITYTVSYGAPDSFFDGLDNLKAILSLSAGIEHLLNHPHLPAGVPIVRLTDAGMADKIAEYVLYGVLRAQRGFAQYEKLQHQKQWQPLADVHAADFRVGVMGIGAIGYKVAERLAAFGYSVSGWKRSPVDTDAFKTFAGAAGLGDFLHNLNVLVCLLPLTDSTKGLIDAELIKQLPAGAHFINAARGGHVNEKDLIDALDNGHLESALLDVCSTEPAPADHPFWHHPSILLTPHIAGPTQIDQSVTQVAESISLLERGELPAGLVDTTIGY